MPHAQPIHPLLEEGIDRKVLNRLRERFLVVNAGRLERALQGMSSRQQRVLRLLPLLFHVNHPLLPGYVSRATPSGLHGYEPDADVLADAQALCRSFAYKKLRAQEGQARAPQQIHGLFLMGSLGTLAHAERSDLDVWVCHDPELDKTALADLQRKCEALSDWAASQGAEAHFFLVDPRRFARGERDERLTSENCGSSQHYLLLEEFYRTAIWLGGRTLAWWLVPTYEEHRYAEYLECLLARRFVRADDVLDLGHLGDIPPGEFLGAGLWQLYKGIASPYKSLLKLLLIEVYASEHPHGQCLALRFKEAVYAHQLELNELDPYLMVYRRLEEYLVGRGEIERLELVRRALYLKVEKKLSRPPTGATKSWQRLLFERLTREWQWTEAQLVLLDNRGQWKVAEVSRERRALVSELIYSFRFLSQFARQHQVASPLDARDLGILGRQLYAAFERKAGKVELINPGISPDMAEEALTLVVSRDPLGEPLWSLYRGSLSLRQCEDFAPLKRAHEPIALLAWCHRNGVIDPGTRFSLHPGDSDLCEAELSAILASLRQLLPLPLPTVPEAALLAPAVPRQVMLLANVGLDPARQPGGSELTELPAAAENRVFSLDQLTLNSWNELLVSRYEGPEALIDCLRDYLKSLPANDAPPPQVQARCHCRNRDPAIGKRLEALFDDVRRHLGEPGQRYLLRWRERLHVLERGADRTISVQTLADVPALVDYLGQTRAGWMPLHLDGQALPGHELELILSRAHPGRIQVFYRVDGDHVELTVLDECNALWRQRQPYRDLPSLQGPLWRFLQSVLFRRSAQLPLDAFDGGGLELSFHEIVASAAGLALFRRSLPSESLGNAEFDVQAVVLPGEAGRPEVSLYCQQREFTQLEHGSRLYAAVAAYILGMRRHGERYPCYLTDLDLSAVSRDGRVHTVQYLRYKTRLEQALNQALAELG